MEGNPNKTMEQVILEDARYPPEAFGFLHDGLARAVETAHGGKPRGEGQQHVSGSQLCQSLRDLAVERWGLLARTVLRKWNIQQSIDFGNMVYLLIENEFMRKTDEDSLEDFRDVYDFDEAFAAYEAFELKE